MVVIRNMGNFTVVLEVGGANLFSLDIREWPS
jgi:hypothetical protein